MPKMEEQREREGEEHEVGQLLVDEAVVDRPKRAKERRVVRSSEVEQAGSTYEFRCGLGFGFGFDGFVVEDAR